MTDTAQTSSATSIAPGVGKRMILSAAFPGFRLRLTRWGGVFLVATLVLGMAAVNTGNNALMGLLGLALASYVVSGAWSRQVLGWMEARVDLPREVYAGRPVVLEVELHNPSRIFPAYGVVVRGDDGKVLMVEPLLSAGGSRQQAVVHTFARRGWTRLGPWRLEVLLPLGFFLKSKEVFRDREVLVYPRLLARSNGGVEGAGGRRSPHALDARGREGEVTQLRDYQYGDERRLVHWKQTARQQRLIVVDRQRQADTPVFFVLDARARDPENPRTLERFERVVSQVATGVVERLDRGETVGLVVGGDVVGPVHSAAQLARLMKPLAEVELQPYDAPAPAAIAGGVVYRVDTAQSARTA